MKVGILGAGQWGTTLSILSANCGHDVYLYDHNKERAKNMQFQRENKQYLSGITLPEKILVCSEVKTIFEHCELVIPVVPSKSFRNFSKEMAPFIKPNHQIVHGIKGLEPTTHKRMSEILNEETSVKQIGAISGPNLALELAKGGPGATVAASENPEVIKKMQEAFASPQFRVYGNPDLIGVEWSGSLKNILAIAAGIVDSLGLGKNTLALLLTRGMAELSNLIVSTGAHTKTFIGLAGFGDVIATCTSPLSRNFRAGRMLAEDKDLDAIQKELKMTIEGLNTVKVATELGKENKVDLPITNALEEVIFEQRPLKQVIHELMSRPATFEFQIE